MNLSPTPIDVHKLQLHSEGFDFNKLQIILKGFKEGFPIHYAGPRVARNSKNLRSALARPDIVSQKINAEIAEKRVAGSFSSPLLRI